jgi:hypothetical protein
MIKTGHPESTCHKCGGPNCTWFVKSELWNRIVRSHGEPEILCPVCFVALAEARGVTPPAWELVPESLETP